MSVEKCQINCPEVPCKDIKEIKSIEKSVIQESKSSNTLPDNQKPLVIRRINVLESVKLHMKIIGCLPIDSEHLPNWCRNVPVNTIHIILVFVILISNLASVWLFHIQEVNSLADLSEAVFWMSRSILSLTLYAMFIWYKSDVIESLNDLDDLVNIRWRQTSLTHIYEKVHKKLKIDARKICYFVYIFIPITYVIPTVYSSYYKYINIHHSSNAFQLFYPIALPFDWKTPFGYALASAVQILFFFSVLEIFITFVSIYFGICRCAVAFAEDIEQNFRDIYQIILNYNGVFPSKDHNLLYRKLCEIIEFHSNAMQFVTSFSRLYQKFMSAFFVTPTSFLCIFCLRLQKDINNNDLINICRSLSRLSGWIVSLFYVCEFGDHITNRFQDITHSIYDCPWYILPTNMIKLLQLSIIIAQRPIYMHGCFNIPCIRETFRTMVYAAFSYFMVLREIL